jgi:hypothetical protein
MSTLLAFYGHQKVCNTTAAEKESGYGLLFHYSYAFFYSIAGKNLDFALIGLGLFFNRKRRAPMLLRYFVA